MVMAMPEWPRISITTRGELPDASRNVAHECRKSWSRIVGVNVVLPSASSVAMTRTRDLMSSERNDRLRLRGSIGARWPRSKPHDDKAVAVVRFGNAGCDPTWRLRRSAW